MRARMIAPLAGLLVLTGCGLPSPSMAAKVGDEVITEQALTTMYTSCSKLELRMDVTRSSVLTMLIYGVIADSFLAAKDIKVDPAELDAVLDRGGIADLDKQPECRNALRSLVKANLVLAPLKPEDIPKVPVLLNPRYGTWSSGRLKITPDVSISQEANPVQDEKR